MLPSGDRRGWIAPRALGNFAGIGRSAGLSPRDASHQAMREVSRPIVAIALVLCAVFVPVAFVSGLTGQFYRQLALTIAFSTVISAINSLTLSPALSAILLRPHGSPPDRLTRALARRSVAALRPLAWQSGKVEVLAEVAPATPPRVMSDTS